MTSDLITSKQDLKKMTVKSLGPGALSLGESLMASQTSFSLMGSARLERSQWLKSKVS